MIAADPFHGFLGKALVHELVHVDFLLDQALGKPEILHILDAFPDCI